jgi:kinesin family protein 6/9
MSGGPQSYKYRGVIPRAISQIFNEVANREDQAFSVRVSFVEIYNELMYDLLTTSDATLSVQDDPRGGVLVKGLSMKLCSNEEEALNCLFEGETNRTVAEHLLNKSSTRSHCVFTIHVESRSRVESSEKVVFSKLNLVDLAGSERTKKTGSEGLTLTEANFINKSLSYLEQVVIALSDRETGFVPYRQSKLTHMLKDSIGGNCKTLMIANVWPEVTHIEETISTLRFATRMMRVSNDAVVNIQLDPAQLIKRYEREIRDLRQELAMHDTLAGRGRILYEPYSPEQQFEMQKVAENYLDGVVEDVEFDSLRMVKELFVQFRNSYRRTLTRLGFPEFKLQKERPESSRTPRTLVRNKQPHTSTVEVQDHAGVGDEEKLEGFGLGTAGPGSKPIDTSALEPKERFVQIEEEESKEPAVESVKKSASRTYRPPIDKNQAFMEFKNSVGRSIEDALRENKVNSTQREFKSSTAQLRSQAAELNSTKANIDDIKTRIEEIRAHRPMEEDVIDEEEFALIKTMKELKQDYRLKYSSLQDLKQDNQRLSQAIEQGRTRLVAEFEAWYEDKFGGRVSFKVPETKAELTKADEDVDPDALAYIKAKKNVVTLHRAKKQLSTARRS